MGIEQRSPWGGIEMTAEEKKEADARRRLKAEEGHGKTEAGVYDLDGLGEQGNYEAEVKAAEEEDPESQKAA